MSRLLHAAARGARIEDNALGGWTSSEFVHLGKAIGHLYRIHPDDAHFQYGPISTALREIAEDYSWNPSWEHCVAHAAANDFAVKFHGEPDYPLFYLILAEALADEGM